MASLAIHMAVGNEYLKNVNVNDKNAFLSGVKYPDICALKGNLEKETVHYSDKKLPNMSLKEKFDAKVDLYRFFSENDINTDYNMGYCCHLLTDYLFLNYFLYKPEFEGKYDFKDIYADYECVAKQMEDEYEVDNSNTPWFGLYRDGEPKLFTRVALKNFIKICANLDYREIRNVVLSNKENWKEKLGEIYVSAEHNLIELQK